MIAAAVHDFDVHIGSGSSSKSFEEVSHEFGLKITDYGNVHLVIDDVGDSAREIDGRHGQGLIHGHDEISCSQDAFLISERFCKGFAEGDSDVFNGVVLVDVEITHTLELKVEAAVTSEQFEHVIKEANSGRDSVASLPVDVEPE